MPAERAGKGAVVEQATPPVAPKESAVELVAQVVPVEGAPLSDVREWRSLPDEEFRELISSPDTQARILKIVEARVRRGTPGDVIEDLVQKANLEALTSKWRPSTRATAPGWLATITVRTVARHFRERDDERQWLELDAEIEGHAGELNAPPDDRWLLGPWLAKVVCENERDQATYELIRYRANTGKTIEQVAEDHAMTPGALKSRTFALKTKYEPRWKRRQRMFLLLLLFGVLAVAALVAWLFWPPAEEYLQPVRNLVVPAGPNIAAPREEPNPAPPREGD